MRVNIKAPDSHKIKQDPIVKKLSKATYQQIDEWVDKNVTGIEDIKHILKWLLKSRKGAGQ